MKDTNPEAGAGAYPLADTPGVDERQNLFLAHITATIKAGTCQLDNELRPLYRRTIKTMQIGELKTHFSQVIECVRKGEKVIISYGKKKENVAVIVPYSEYERANIVRLGILKGKARYRFNENFEMTSEELLNT